MEGSAGRPRRAAAPSRSGRRVGARRCSHGLSPPPSVTSQASVLPLPPPLDSCRDATCSPALPPFPRPPAPGALQLRPMLLALAGVCGPGPAALGPQPRLRHPEPHLPPPLAPEPGCSNLWTLPYTSVALPAKVPTPALSHSSPPPPLPKAPPLPACKSPDWAPEPSPTQIPHPALPALKMLEETELRDCSGVVPARPSPTRSQPHTPAATQLAETRTGAHMCSMHSCVYTCAHVCNRACASAPPSAGRLAPFSWPHAPHSLLTDSFPPLQRPQGPVPATWTC